MTPRLMKIFIAEYLIGCAVAIWERQWSMALYWLGAALLNIAVLRGCN